MLVVLRLEKLVKVGIVNTLILMIDQTGITINAEIRITNLVEPGVTQQTQILDGSTVIKFQVFIWFESLS